MERPLAGGKAARRREPPEAVVSWSFCLSPPEGCVARAPKRTIREIAKRNAMYAVIETGGKQYRVAPGQTIEVETLPAEAGAEIEVGRVLAVVDGESVKAGPAAEGVRVLATV